MDVDKLRVRPRQLWEEDNRKEKEGEVSLKEQRRGELRQSPKGTRGRRTGAQCAERQRYYREGGEGRGGKDADEGEGRNWGPHGLLLSICRGRP